ncbi:conserved hypothetical protein [Flavobacterium sp. 9AF]|uniref:hypothetical protein n=1 Tax=Flavobacterium sp. 9AF TaxID=2653142 RepID=UPI0012F0CB26|nr:hypothetical protein [Flavobacterium sp. 9AF]VXB30428.1 conserved hypothetical protein [Flavobacterium sp. 9AF]
MSFTITYKTLCEITVLHSYFLNNGTDEFSSMTDAQKAKMLKNYKYKNYLEIIPSQATAKLLKNNHLVFIPLPNSIKIGVKVDPNNENATFANIALDTTLDFIIRIKDYLFENYTAITATSQQLFYISNAKPVDEPVSFKYIPLASEAVFIADDYKVTEVSKAKILASFEANEKTGIFGVVSLKMQADNSNLNLLSPLQEIIIPTPTFKIHFDNRKTFWKYIKTNSSFEVETTVEKPLTQNGFVEITPADFTTSPPEVNDFQYPNPSVNSIQKIATKVYSQIFI